MTPLKRLILDLIHQGGPVSVARYMELALAHPDHGYYITRDPLGRAGDFTTAPEISQVFGELIGLWCAQVWMDAGAPSRVLLAEAGPGRGTLLADILRACRAVPGFGQAIELQLVETSPVLRLVQEQKLLSLGARAQWHLSLDTLPTDAPLLLVANEFLDALPIRQFECRSNRWHERQVGTDGASLVFGLAPDPEPSLMRSAPDGSILEIAPVALEAVRAIARRIVDQGGAALLVDYGHAEPGFGDTLQAMREHAFADVLDAPGEADLTAHVDFAAMAAAARAAGAKVHGPLTQGDLLERLGIGIRAARLAVAAPERASDIRSGCSRLTEMTPTGMGQLFKAIAITRPDAPSPPGFAG